MLGWGAEGPLRRRAHGEVGFRSPEKGKVGEGTKGKRTGTETWASEAEQPPMKGHADLSRPQGEACGCTAQLQEGAVLWGSLGKSLPQWGAITSLLASPRFEEENQRLLELNQRCQFASSATMQWLDIRLQLMGTAVVSAIAGIALVQHQQGLANPGTAPGPSCSPQKHVIPIPWPRPLPTLSPSIFSCHPGFPMRMYYNSPAPDFRVEETESQEVTGPGDGSGTRTSLLTPPLPRSTPTPSTLPGPPVCHLPFPIASPDPLHCLASGLLWCWSGAGIFLLLCWPPLNARSPQLQLPILPYSSQHASQCPSLP